MPFRGVWVDNKWRCVARLVDEVRKTAAVDVHQVTWKAQLIRICGLLESGCCGVGILGTGRENRASQDRVPCPDWPTHVTRSIIQLRGRTRTIQRETGRPLGQHLRVCWCALREPWMRRSERRRSLAPIRRDLLDEPAAISVPLTRCTLYLIRTSQHDYSVGLCGAGATPWTSYLEVSLPNAGAAPR